MRSNTTVVAVASAATAAVAAAGVAGSLRVMTGVKNETLKLAKSITYAGVNNDKVAPVSAGTPHRYRAQILLWNVRLHQFQQEHHTVSAGTPHQFQQEHQVKQQKPSILLCFPQMSHTDIEAETHLTAESAYISCLETMVDPMLHDILVHFNGSVSHILNVNPYKYNYMQLLADACEAALTNVPGNFGVGLNLGREMGTNESAQRGIGTVVERSTIGRFTATNRSTVDELLFV
ncbi:hypothetical protein LOK49_LG10G02042 [Camellia lanceoleosa]|uniref:Uncharacterized protein n=1 Tax=Camellia lanceoleosa TaxID=1840588 RepID=A0ACC0GAH4_9ERIC|nr:hypothetical protein LOK49_LG10G02042 [Camellia lanceoleosa]